MSGNIYRKIGFDVTGAMASINKLNGAIKSLSNNMKTLGSGKSGFSGIGQGAAQAGPALMSFTNGSKAAIKSLDDLVKQSQHAAAGMKGLAPGIAPATEAVSMFSRVAGKVSGVLTLLGGAKQVFFGLVNAIRQSAAAAAEFGIKIAEVQTIASELNMTNEQLSDSVLRLSSQFGSAAGDVAAGLYQALSNQVVEAGQEFGFLEEALKLAKVGVSSTADAIDSMSSVMNAYNMNAGEMTRVSGTLFKAVDLGRFKLGDLAQILGRVTPIAAQVGISWEEVAASLAVMTQQGVRADTAVTQLRAAITKIIKPTEAMQAVYEKWGVKDGPTAIATFGGLKGVLEKLQQETKGSTAEMSVLFNEVRGLAGVLALGTNGGKDFADALNQITEAGEKGINEVFQKFAESDAQKYNVAINAMKNEWIKFGQTVLPIVTALTQALNGMLIVLGAVAGGVSTLAKRTFGNSTVFQQQDIARQEQAQAKRSEELGRQQQPNLWDTKEAKAAIGEFNRLLIDALQNYQETSKGIIRTQDDIARSFVAFSQTTTARFTDAINGIKSRLDELPGKINEITQGIRDAKNNVVDEELSQKLENAEGNAAQRVKILKEAAEREYQEFRKQASNQTMTEEAAAEAENQRKRALAAQKALEAEARSGGDKGAVNAANARALELAKEEVTLKERLKKALIDEGNLLASQADKLIAKQKELVALDKERVKAAKEYRKAIDSGDQGAIDAAGKKLDDITEKQFDEGKLDAGMKKALDSQGGAGVGDALEKALTVGLAKASDNFQKWTLEQQQMLKEQQMKIQITPEINLAEFMEIMQKAGTQVSQRDIMGSVSRFENDQVKLEADRGQAQNNMDAATSELKSANSILNQTATTLDQRANEVKNVAPEVGNLGGQLLDLQRQAAKGVQISPETIQNLASQIEQAKVETTNIAQDNLLDAMSDNLKAFATQMAAEMKAVKAAASLEDANEATRPGRDAMKIIEEAAGGTVAKLSEVPMVLVTAKERADALKVVMDDTGNSAATTNLNVASIQNGAAVAVGGIGNISAALDGVIAKAEAAAAKVAAIAAGAAAGGSHFGGAHFARGGLGMLAPRGTDTIPAMIQRGEFVMNKKSTGKYFSQLQAMNNGIRPVYRREGGSVTNVGDVNVTVEGGDTSRQTVRAIARELRHELRRGTIRFN